MPIKTSPNTFVIGIAGGTGSGKTTIAKRIESALPGDSTVLLEHDSYYKDHSDIPIEERCKLNYDHPDALDNALVVEHLKTLRRGEAIEVPVYNYRTHAREVETQRVEPRPIVVFEGILVFVDERLRDLMDLKIFVDTDADIRIMRRVRRDMETRGRDFSSIREQYYNTVRPMHLQFVEPSKRWADLVIPEGGNNDVALDTIVGRLMYFLHRREAFGA